MIEASSHTTCPGASFFLGNSNNSSRKEPELKLSLEVRKHSEEVAVVVCKGRIVYRDEVTAFSRAIADLLVHARQLVLELSKVETIDGAGLGELLSLLSAAQASGCALKLAAPSKAVRELLELTKVATSFEIHATVNDALLHAHAHAQAV